MPLLARASYQGVVSVGFLWSNRPVPVLDVTPPWTAQLPQPGCCLYPFLARTWSLVVSFLVTNSQNVALALSIPVLARERSIVPSWSSPGSLTALVSIKQLLQGICLGIFLSFLVSKLAIFGFP